MHAFLAWAATEGDVQPALALASQDGDTGIH